MRALGIRIYSSQDCHTASLNGLLTHLSIGWANVVHPPGIRTTSALQFSYLNVFTVLMWSILIHHKKSAMVLPFKYRSEPPLVFYCCLPSICCCTHSDIVRYVEGSPNSHTQTATPLFEENGSFSPVAVAARATVNPFFTAFVVFILMSFFPLTSLVLLLGMSKRTIVWSMLMMSDGSILWTFRQKLELG